MSQLKASPVPQLSARALVTFENTFIPEPNSGCWLWMKDWGSRGYGQFEINGRMYLSHRISYSTYVGPIPHGAHVLHKCDNPACVNPDHLYLGTHRENMRDMSRRGRGKPPLFLGEACPWARVTDEMVRKIRLEKRTSTLAAPDYGIAASTFNSIRRGEKWSHVK